jgi:hypothetical protein
LRSFKRGATVQATRNSSESLVATQLRLTIVGRNQKDHEDLPHTCPFVGETHTWKSHDSFVDTILKGIMMASPTAGNIVEPMKVQRF